MGNAVSTLYIEEQSRQLLTRYSYSYNVVYISLHMLKFFMLMKYFRNYTRLRTDFILFSINRTVFYSFLNLHAKSPGKSWKYSMFFLFVLESPGILVLIVLEKSKKCPGKSWKVLEIQTKKIVVTM